MAPCRSQPSLFFDSRIYRLGLLILIASLRSWFRSPFSIPRGDCGSPRGPHGTKASELLKQQDFLRQEFTPEAQDQSKTWARGKSYLYQIGVPLHTHWVGFWGLRWAKHQAFWKLSSTCRASSWDSTLHLDHCHQELLRAPSRSLFQKRTKGFQSNRGMVTLGWQAPLGIRIS